jgi:hypothetical protein
MGQTPKEYRGLAAKCSKEAQAAASWDARYRLEMLAESYRTLATIMDELNRSAKMLEALRQGKQ